MAVHLEATFRGAKLNRRACPAPARDIWRAPLRKWAVLHSLLVPWGVSLQL